MRSRIYEDMESLDKDLHILNLERQIAWEEIKSVKEDYKEDLKPLKWIQSALAFASKLGAMLLVRKIVK